MTIIQSARIALRALRVNKLRSALTMLGIIIGVGAVIAMVSVGAGAQARVAEQIQSLGSNLIIVMSGSVTSSGIRLGQGSQLTITEDDASAIAREVSLVQVAAPSTRGTTQVVYGNLNWATVIQGVTGDYLEARDWPIVAGRSFNPEENEAATKVALVGQTTAFNLFGDAEPIGQVIRIKKVPFTVVGRYRSAVRRHSRERASRHRIARLHFADESPDFSNRPLHQAQGDVPRFQRRRGTKNSDAVCGSLR